jgi:hypothetical protein
MVSPAVFTTMIFPPAKSDEITGSAWEKAKSPEKKNRGISRDILFKLILISIY